MSRDLLQIFAALQQQMSASISRSDVLRPLHVVVFLLATLLTATIGLKAPDWAVAGVSGLFGLSVLMELGAFLYCLIMDPDLLRSEKVRLQKMAIEAHFLGDSTQGSVEEPIDNTNPKKIDYANSGRALNAPNIEGALIPNLEQPSVVSKNVGDDTGRGSP